jgi:hypothetical protein
MSGFGLDPKELSASADQITKTLSDVRQGPLGEIGGGGAAVFGHAGVASAVSDFCTAVESAMEVMTKTADAAGDNLRSAATSYVQHDDQARQGLGKLANGSAEMPPQGAR